MSSNENQRCFFTGHRIMSRYERGRAALLTESLCEKLILTRGVTEFISGGAIGYDHIAALAVLRLKKKYPVRLCLYLPCRDRAARWSGAQIREWKTVEEAADECRYITDGPYITGCMHRRNRAMVDDAVYGIAFCRSGYGGTAATLRYATDKGRKTFVLTVPGTELPFGTFYRRYI